MTQKHRLICPRAVTDPATVAPGLATACHESYHRKIMCKLLVVLTLLTSCATGGPQWQYVMIDGQEARAIRHPADGTWSASGCRDTGNAVTIKQCLVAAVEKASGCKVTDAEFRTSTIPPAWIGLLLDTTVDCIER